MEKKKYKSEVTLHHSTVFGLMWKLIDELEHRQATHDQSKLQPEEFDLYSKVSPEIKKTEFGSEEYKQAVAKLGPALTHHYENNRHHPEHFPNGVQDMNLVDLMEMVCDWVAVSKVRGTDPREGMVKVQFPKYGITEPLASVLLNTVGFLEQDNQSDENHIRGLDLAAEYLQNDSPEYQARIYKPIRELEKKIEKERTK